MYTHEKTTKENKRKIYMNIYEENNNENSRLDQRTRRNNDWPESRTQEMSRTNFLTQDWKI